MAGRESLRLKLDRNHPVRITLKHSGKPTLSGMAANLSVTGAAFWVKPTGSRFPARGEQYLTCRLVLPQQDIIYSQATIVHGRFDPDVRHTLMGIVFDDMDDEDERRLQRFLCSLQAAPRRLAYREPEWLPLHA